MKAWSLEGEDFDKTLLSPKPVTLLTTFPSLIKSLGIPKDSLAVPLPVDVTVLQVVQGHKEDLAGNKQGTRKA